MSTITVTQRPPDLAFNGANDPASYTHIAVTPAPTLSSETVYLPVIDRKAGAHYSVQPEGLSGYHWMFSAELPPELLGKEVEAEVVRQVAVDGRTHYV